MPVQEWQVVKKLNLLSKGPRIIVLDTDNGLLINKSPEGQVRKQFQLTQVMQATTKYDDPNGVVIGFIGGQRQYELSFPDKNTAVDFMEKLNKAKPNAATMMGMGGAGMVPAGAAAAAYGVGVSTPAQPVTHTAGGTAHVQGAQAQTSYMGINYSAQMPSMQTSSAQMEPIAGVSLEDYAKASALGAEGLEAAQIEERMGWPAGKWDEANAGWQDRMSKDMAVAMAFGNMYTNVGGRVPTSAPEGYIPEGPPSREPFMNVSLEKYAEFMARLEKYGTGIIEQMCQEVGTTKDEGWGKIVGHWQTMQGKDAEIARDIVNLKSQFSRSI